MEEGDGRTNDDGDGDAEAVAVEAEGCLTILLTTLMMPIKLLQENSRCYCRAVAADFAAALPPPH